MNKKSSGESIIKFADILKVILIVLSAIEGLIAIILLTSAFDSFILAFLIGLAVFGIGLLAAIIANILLRGYGELILSTANIENKLNEMAAKQEDKASAEENGTWKCSCGRVNKAYISTCACGKSKEEN